MRVFRPQCDISKTLVGRQNLEATAWSATTPYKPRVARRTVQWLLAVAWLAVSGLAYGGTAQYGTAAWMGGHGYRLFGVERGTNVRRSRDHVVRPPTRAHLKHRRPPYVIYVLNPAPRVIAAERKVPIKPRRNVRPRVFRITPDSCLGKMVTIDPESGEVRIHCM